MVRRGRLELSDIVFACLPMSHHSASRPSKDEAITIQGIDIDRHIAPSNGHKLVTPSAAAMSRGTQTHTSALRPRSAPHTPGNTPSLSAPLACAS